MVVVFNLSHYAYCLLVQFHKCSSEFGIKPENRNRLNSTNQQILPQKNRIHFTKENYREFKNNFLIETPICKDKMGWL